MENGKHDKAKPFEVPDVELAGWELVYAGNTRWLGKVIEDGDPLILLPGWELIGLSKNALLLPKPTPAGMVPAVEWLSDTGGNVVPILNDVESVPRIRIYKPYTARVALSEMAKTKRADIRRLIAELLEKAKPKSHSNVLDFGGAGPKVQ